jgi:hypothetical protein
VPTHSNFVSKYIDMSLHEWNWLRKNVETCTYQVNVKNFVVAHNTKDALIKITSLLRTEVYHDSSLGVRFDRANCLTKAESVARISVELKLSG